jgi:hypothetical protein
MKNKNKKREWGIIFLLILPVCYGFAYDEKPDANNVIVRFEVIGLKRTKDVVLHNTLDRFVGQKADEIDLNAVHAAIIETGILNPEKIEIRDAEDGKILFVEVIDKWPIMAFPLFMINSNGDVSGGLMAMHMNAFGINDRFMLAGQYGVVGVLALASYAHSGLRRNVLPWNISGAYKYGGSGIADQENRAIHRWTSHSASASAGIGYSFFKGVIRSSFRIGFSDIILVKKNTDFFPPESGVMRISLMPSIGYYKSNYDGYLLVSQSLSLSYQAAFGINCGIVQTIGLRGLFEKSLIPGFKMNFSAAAVHAFNADMFTLVRPSASAPILPSSFGARTFFAASGGLEKSIWKMKYGTVSLAVNYHVLESESPDLGWGFDHGPGAALYFSLSRIAIPGASVTFNYNVAKNHFELGFLGGISF